jgi:hypothetical protein
MTELTDPLSINSAHELPNRQRATLKRDEHSQLPESSTTPVQAQIESLRAPSLIPTHPDNQTRPSRTGKGKGKAVDEDGQNRPTVPSSRRMTRRPARENLSQIFNSGKDG